MWRKGEISIAEEHRATELTVEIISYLREHIVPKPALGRKALGAVVEGDQHLLGARIVADMLYEDGWDVEFLGGNTPNEAFVDHLVKCSADIVLISASAEAFLPALKSLVSLLRKQFPNLVIIAGGIGLLTGSITAKELGVDYIACAFEDAISNARKQLGIEGSSASLKQLLGTVGSRIRHYRTERGISQQELARLAKLDRAYISSLENGKKNISVGTLLRIAEAVDTDVKNLIS